MSYQRMVNSVSFEDIAGADPSSPPNFQDKKQYGSTELSNKAIDYSKAKKLPVFIAAISATWSAFILGALIGWSSPVQPQLQHVPNASVLPHVQDNNSVWYMNLTNTQMSWVGSLVNAGALMGALSGGSVMDLFGRQKVLLLLSLPYTVSWLFAALAVHPSMLYIGRLVGGFAGGISSVVAPSYISEIALPSIRGTLGFFFQLMVVMGILVASLFGLGLDWRLISAICIIFPIISLFSMIYVPESPYYLLKKGKTLQAIKSLEWLRGPDFDKTAELEQITEAVKYDLENRGSIKSMFKIALKPFLIAMSLMVFQQLSGINAALFNAVSIFQSAGSTMDPLISAVLLNITQVLASLVSSVLVERLGRKTLFLVSEAFMALSMVALGVFFYLTTVWTPEDIESIGWLPLLSLILFIAAFGIGAGPMPWMMLGELLPTRFKGPGSSLASFTNWFLAFIVTVTFVDLQEAIGSAATFWMFGGFCVLGVLFTIFLLPETKGKSRAEIDGYFGIVNVSSPSSSNNLVDKSVIPGEA